MRISVECLPTMKPMMLFFVWTAGVSNLLLLRLSEYLRTVTFNKSIWEFFFQLGLSIRPSNCKTFETTIGLALKFLSETSVGTSNNSISFVFFCNLQCFRTSKQPVDFFDQGLIDLLSKPRRCSVYEIFTFVLAPNHVKPMFSRSSNSLDLCKIKIQASYKNQHILFRKPQLAILES